MTERKGVWVFSFILNEDDRVSVRLSGGRIQGRNEYEIDTLLIEGAYEIIRQSEQFAALIAEKAG